MVNANTGREAGSGVGNDNPVYHNLSLAKPKGSEMVQKLVDLRSLAFWGTEQGGRR